MSAFRGGFTGLVPIMGIGRVHAPRQAILRLVVTVIRNRELNPVIGLLESRHHIEDDGLVIVLLQAGEIEVGREASLAADDHLAEAGAALEHEAAEQAAFRQELQEIREHDLFFRDHDVAKAGLNRVALHLRLRKHPTRPL